jgi:hypothetical protein
MIRIAAAAAIALGFTQISCAKVPPATDTSAARVSPTSANARGTLRFGKLMMLDAEMQIVDLRPSGFFGFSLDRYQEQLVAGYERTLPDMGLLVYMLGVEKLGSASGAPASPPR